MAAKKSTDVMIAGKVYTLSGYEEEGYLQRVAAYINAKISEITEREEFRRIPNEMRSILIELNIADDYFKARTRFEDVEENYKKAEKELFDLKHELVDTQMKVEELAEKLDSERQEKTTKNAREQALEEQYKKLEDKYQLLLSNAKIADEKNRQFEEILRLSQQEKRELESVNKELRMNKEKLESALADALFGASRQSEDVKPPESEQAPIVVELSEEEKQAIAELAKINEPLSLELSEADHVKEKDDTNHVNNREPAAKPGNPDKKASVETASVRSEKMKTAPVQMGTEKKSDSKMLTLAEKKQDKGNGKKEPEKDQVSSKTYIEPLGRDSDQAPDTESDSFIKKNADKKTAKESIEESDGKTDIGGDLINFSKEPDVDILETPARTGTEFSEEIEPVRTSFAKENESTEVSGRSMKNPIVNAMENPAENTIQLTDSWKESEEDFQETDDVFAEISEDDDPELKEIAKQIAEMNRQEKAEKRKKKAKK